MGTEPESVVSAGAEFGYYVEVIFRRWYFVVVPAVLFAFATALVLLVSPVKYRASVLIVQVKLPAQDQAAGASEQSIDLVPFSKLVQSEGVAEAVVSQIGDSLLPKERNARSLLRIVDVTVAPPGTQIAIEVTYQDADVAANIAHAWAQESIGQINGVYEQFLDDSLGRVHDQTAAALSHYEERQLALESSLGTDKGPELRRSIDELSAIVGSFGATRLAESSSIIDRLRQTDDVLRSALELAAQLGSGGEGAAQSNSVALQALKLRAFGLAGATDVQQFSEPLQPGTGGATVTEETGYSITQAVTLVQQQEPVLVQLQAAPLSMSRSEMITDINSLVSVLTERHQSLADELQKRLAAAREGKPWFVVQDPNRDSDSAQASLADSDVRLTEESLEQRLRDLTSQSEQQRERVLEATVRRDIARDAYTSLLREEARLQLIKDTGGSNLDLATAGSVAPGRSEVIQPAVLAGTSGLVLGLLAAFGLEYWQQYKRRPAERETLG
jgi:hypothetical protein